MADMIKSSGIPITMVAASAMAAVPPAIAAVRPPAIAAPPPAIDMEHLSHMTLGERGLEIEVLRLFERQAELLLARMREVGPEGVATLAHTLSGSAKGIGAWRVAAAAEATECAVKQSTPLDPAMAGLAASVDEARRAIAGLLDVAGLDVAGRMTEIGGRTVGDRG
jgi:HPt (histidine-containing phosphotransfer) domain-containing protein